ncbi:MAG: DUF2752 domain-containing protein [Bacteroidales bacterium]|nr:DUF2752 domain-containing protein [Bacteroidales bacterium]
MKRPGEPYIIINFVLAGVIILVMVYSLIFSPDRGEYPVVCIHEKITGEECVSCGLSHSFSLILRGRIDEAYRWNSYGMRIFIFFAAQLFMRIAFSRIYLRNPSIRRNLILFDTIGSSVIFLIAFMPFLVWICRFC